MAYKSEFRNLQPHLSEDATWFDILSIQWSSDDFKCDLSVYRYFLVSLLLEIGTILATF